MEIMCQCLNNDDWSSFHLSRTNSEWLTIYVKAFNIMKWSNRWIKSPASKADSGTVMRIKKLCKRKRPYF